MFASKRDAYSEILKLQLRVERLEAQVRHQEGEIARPGLQALIDEYKKFGGQDDYAPCGTEIRYVPHVNYPFGVVSFPTYNARAFEDSVLTPQKAKWAEEHTCDTGKSKKVPTKSTGPK